MNDNGNGETLVFYEKNRIFLPNAESLEKIREEDFHDLLRGFRDISFSYLKPGEEDGPPEWQDTWDHDADGPVPLAVRLTLEEDETSRHRDGGPYRCGDLIGRHGKERPGIALFRFVCSALLTVICGASSATP